jgi:2-polyprenyl-3-methyl-5-hydroxy-6-metoxy-1,4-benzoquinol methylase
MSQFKDVLYAQYAQTIFKDSKPITLQRFEDYARYYKKTLSPFLPENKDAHILDIGCGFGHLLYFLKEQGYVNHFGIDRGEEQVEICRQLVTANVENACNVPVYLSSQPEKYETVFLFDVLEHIDDEEMFPLLDAIRTSLHAGGRLIISVPNAACFPTLITLYGDLTHRRLFSEVSLKQLFLASGFTNVKVFPHEKTVIRSFRSRRAKLMWQVRNKFVRWLLSEFHLHLMEGSYPEVQTVNILCVVEK